jgi:hypothetical protein
MRPVRRSSVSPALVVACLALLVSLTGTSIAAVQQLVPRNSVGSEQLKKNAVTTAKVRNGSLLRADFKSGQLPRGPQGLQAPMGRRDRVGRATFTVPRSSSFRSRPARPSRRSAR